MHAFSTKFPLCLRWALGPIFDRRQAVVHRASPRRDVDRWGPRLGLGIIGEYEKPDAKRPTNRLYRDASYFSPQWVSPRSPASSM